MKVNFFITKDGILKRKQNTVYFVRKNENGELEKRILPINKIYSMFAHGRLSFSSGVVSYLSKYGVPIHFISPEKLFFFQLQYHLSQIVIQFL